MSTGLPTLPQSLILTTNRMLLEPVDETHASELHELFGDSELHQFTPFELLTLEQQRERCARWAKRRSPDGTELWLNWVGREKDSQKVVAHFQSGVKNGSIASIGYLVARCAQRKGIATEGLVTVIDFLKNSLGLREVKAWTDTRNKASHSLALKLGMKQVEFIKDADFFKGSTSNEFVFSKLL